MLGEFHYWPKKWSQNKEGTKKHVKNHFDNTFLYAPIPKNSRLLWRPSYLRESDYLKISNAIKEAFREMWYCYFDVFISAAPRALSKKDVRDALFLTYSFKRDPYKMTDDEYGVYPGKDHHKNNEIKDKPPHPETTDNSNAKNLKDFLSGRYISSNDIEEYRYQLLGIGIRFLNKNKQINSEDSLVWEDYRYIVTQTLYKSITDEDRKSYRMIQSGIIKGFSKIFEIMEEKHKSPKGLGSSYFSLSKFCGENRKSFKFMNKTLSSFYICGAIDRREKFKDYLYNLSKEEQLLIANQFAHFILNHIQETPLSFHRLLLERVVDAYYPWCNSSSFSDGVKLSFPKEKLIEEINSLTKHTNYNSYLSFVEKEKALMGKQNGIHNMISVPVSIKISGLILRMNIRVMNRFVYDETKRVINIISKDDESESFWQIEKDQIEFISELIMNRIIESLRNIEH